MKKIIPCPSHDSPKSKITIHVVTDVRDSVSVSNVYSVRNFVCHTSEFNEANSSKISFIAPEGLDTTRTAGTFLL